MKKLIIFFCFFSIISAGFSQNLPTDPITGKVTYTSVVPQVNSRSETIILKFRAFAVNGLSSNNLTITSQNPAIGEVYLSGVFPINEKIKKKVFADDGQMVFTGTILVTNASISYNFTDFVHTSEGGTVTTAEAIVLGASTASGNLKKYYRHIKSQIDDYMTILTGELDAKFNSTEPILGMDDW